MDNIPRNFPHKCGTSTTWLTENNNTEQYKVVCSYCRKILGYWNWTAAVEERVYPQQKKDSKFSTTQKRTMR